MIPQGQSARGGVLFIFYALVVCVVAVLGLSVKVAEMGFHAAEPYFLGPLDPLDEEWLLEDEHVLSLLNWPEDAPPPNIEKVRKIKQELRTAWELNARRYGTEKIVKAGLEAIAFAILWAVHWRWARRLQERLDT